MSDVVDRIDRALLSHSLERAMGSPEARAWVEERIDICVTLGHKHQAMLRDQGAMFDGSVMHCAPMVAVRADLWQEDPEWDEEAWNVGLLSDAYVWTADHDTDPLATWRGADLSGRKACTDEVPF